MTVRSSLRSAARAGRVTQVLGAVVVVTALALVLVSTGSRGQARPASQAAESSEASPAAEASTGSSAASSAAAGVNDRSVPAPRTVAEPVAAGLRPVRITIPTIGVDAAITDLAIAGDGTIEVPKVPARAGWLTTSPAPGQRGPAVIAGHVDSTTGPAVFYRLRELKPGDQVIITRTDGQRVRFTVDGLRTYAKDDFSTQAAYGPVPGPALRLITCGGSYVKSRGGYLDNLVVFAT